MAQFDFHFHLLFKHAVSGKDDVNENIDVKGFADLLNKVFGGPFESQSSPKMVTGSPLYFGVMALLAVEHAFVNNMLHFPGFRLDRALPLDQQMIADIRDGKTTYNSLFEKQLRFTLDKIEEKKEWKIRLLNRSNKMTTEGKEALDELKKTIADPNVNLDYRYFALSIEGGHNLSEVPIMGKQTHQTPEDTLQRLLNRANVDFISMNLCHLSFIPEQNLGGFAQGLNKSAQLAFHSEDFSPSAGLGITPLGRKVIKAALTHKEKPVIIDVKHMSLYTRLQYYKYKKKLAQEFPDVERLPIISSHTGFTFNTLAAYIGERQYQPELGIDNRGRQFTRITPLERRIGRTDDWINKGLHSNPWTIGLFDEEILEIFQSNGLIGISLDQRVLGTENIVVDSNRGQFYEAEHLAREEYIKLFRDQQLPEAEGLGGLLRKVTPSPRERHSMLLALHIVHAVRLGLSTGISGSTNNKDASPWDYLCIGSDFDGLINPINAIKDVTYIGRLKDELMTYLPQADKSLPFYKEEKALRYDAEGRVDKKYMEEMIDKVLTTNGLRFLQRFLNNWNEQIL